MVFCQYVFTRDHSVWHVSNLFLFVKKQSHSLRILYYRLYGGAAYKPFCWIEWCLASIFALNAAYHISQYAWASFTVRSVTLSPTQRRLLGVAEDDPIFKNQVPTPQKASEPISPLNLSCISLNRRLTSLGSPGLSESSKKNFLFIYRIARRRWKSYTAYVNFFSREFLSVKSIL